jgi:hypothetical protein
MKELTYEEHQEYNKAYDDHVMHMMKKRKKVSPSALATLFACEVKYYFQ